MRKLLLIVCSVLVCVHNLEATEPAAPSCSEPAVVVSAQAPNIPELAAKAGVVMEVPVEVTIDGAGVVVAASVLPGFRAPMRLDEAATSAAREWKFAPIPACESRVATLTFDFKRPLPRGHPGRVVFVPPYRIEVASAAVLVDVRPIP